MTRLSPGFAINPFFRSYTFVNSQKLTSLSVQVGSRRRNFSRIGSESGDGVAFDAVAYESERLSLDAVAMEDMAETAKKELESDPDNDPKAWKWVIRKKMWDLMEARNYAMSPRPVHHRIPNFVDASAAAGKELESDPDNDPKAWKWVIRKKMWDLMEARNYAMSPRPVHHRIPNFVGASAAARKVCDFDLPSLLSSLPNCEFLVPLAELDAFRMATVVKVNPDSPQKQIRFLTLSGDKKLLTPQPRLRTGFFSVLESDLLKPETIMEACTSVGVAKYGRAIGLDEKIKVDLIIIGSVAVNPQTGARLGKGEGFAELEYGMLRYMGAIDDSTPVVTTVHDCQLVDDIPLEKLAIHDVPVDIICTPTRVIFTNTPIPKPQGIYWDKLSPEKLRQIRILRELKKRLEKNTGRKLPTGPSEKLPPTAERKRR